MIHTVKDFAVVIKVEIDVFLELSCSFDDPVDVGNLISGSSAFSKSSLNIWKFMVQVLLKPGLENFEPYFASMWDECSCAVVWIFFSIAFLWDWNENWPFLVLWPLLRFPYMLAYWVQHFHFRSNLYKPHNFCINNFKDDYLEGDHLKPIYGLSQDHRLKVKNFWSEWMSSFLPSLYKCLSLRRNLF